MDRLNLEKKKQYVRDNIYSLSPVTVDNYDSNFRIEYNHHSTAIEGNTLTLMQTYPPSSYGKYTTRWYL
jgi:hypothetical protein